MTTDKKPDPLTACKQYCLAAGATQGNIAYTQNVIRHFIPTNRKKVKVKIDSNEIISLTDFELGWRFDKTRNPNISDFELSKILPFSENESKRLNEIIEFYEIYSNLRQNYYSTDWLCASSENEQKEEQFRKTIECHLEPFDEELIISWNRNIVAKTTKSIFLKYWSDFLYASSDDATIISEQFNWILFYRHFEVANLWIKN